jgi:hypothetical protein
MEYCITPELQEDIDSRLHVVPMADEEAKDERNPDEFTPEQILRMLKQVASRDPVDTKSIRFKGTGRAGPWASFELALKFAIDTSKHEALQAYCEEGCLVWLIHKLIDCTNEVDYVHPSGIPRGVKVHFSTDDENTTTESATKKRKLSSLIGESKK